MKRVTEFLQEPRNLALVVVAGSAATLAAAYISQYGFGLKPCILCLYQRVPYFVNIALGLLAALATLRYPRLAVLFLWLAAVSFIANAAIAGFHVGVEYKWWPGLPACGGAVLPENATIEELRAAITQQKTIVRCDDAAWRFLGISMAGYNLIISLVAAGVMACLLRKSK